MSEKRIVVITTTHAVSWDPEESPMPPEATTPYQQALHIAGSGKPLGQCDREHRTIVTYHTSDPNTVRFDSEVSPVQAMLLHAIDTGDYNKAEAILRVMRANHS